MILFINTSPRSGNSEFIMKQLHDTYPGEKKLILLRNQAVKHCIGCLYCHEHEACVQADDMQKIYKDIINSDTIVMGIPNYFESVNGLCRNFMDRCHPYYKTKRWEGKRIYFIYVGGGEMTGTTKHLDQSVYGFAKHLGFEIIGSSTFRALERNDMKSQKLPIDEIISQLEH